MSSCSPGSTVVDIVCDSLTASLCVKDLHNSSSRCVRLGSVVLTPCEFEHRAGRRTAKNWKKSIRFNGKPLGEFWSRIPVLKGKDVLSLQHLVVLERLSQHPGVLMMRQSMMPHLYHCLVLL